MSLLLFIVGAIALMAGVSMAAYGIPINEFSFGNTLIVAGCSLAAGGLIVIGLGAVVAQLHRIAETLTVWSPGRSSVADLFDDRDRGGIEPVPTGNRVPFPQRRLGRLRLPTICLPACRPCAIRKRRAKRSPKGRPKRSLKWRPLRSP